MNHKVNPVQDQSETNGSFVNQIHTLCALQLLCFLITLFLEKEYKLLGMMDLNIGPYQLSSSHYADNNDPNHHGRLFYFSKFSPDNYWIRNAWYDGQDWFQVKCLSV